MESLYLLSYLRVEVDMEITKRSLKINTTKQDKNTTDKKSNIKYFCVCAKDYCLTRLLP